MIKVKFKSKRAFTLVELIMVIVLVAILSTFGTDIYTNIYKNYIYSKSINELETKTEIALEQIASRLNDRIHQATIGRKASGEITHIESVDSTYPILEWIGQSTESRNLYSNAGISSNRPIDSVGWSGYIDVDASIAGSTATNGILITPGSKLTGERSATTVLRSLGIENPTTNLAVIFDVDGDGTGYGLNGGVSDIAKLMRVNLTHADADTMNVINDGYSGNISERYFLAHSAYAIIPTPPVDYIAPDGTTFRDFTLNLHYNYRPWMGETSASKTTKIQPIAQNVTLFRFRGNFGSIELKLCMRDPKFTDSDFIVCKTKVVF